MKKRKLRIGIVGLGRILPRHLNDSIKQIKELELAAVCDLETKLAKKIGLEEKIKFYTNYKDLVNDEDVDVVSVLTPNYLHFEIGKYIAKKGKHCIMEKPLCQNYKDAVLLVKLFEESKKKLFPVLQVRYNPPIRIVKEYVEKGFLGKILTAILTINWARPQEYYDESKWKGRKKLDGGSLLTQAIHYIDSAYYILGKAKSVIGKIDTVGHKIEVEDIAHAILDFENGTRLGFNFSVCTYPHNLECSLTILGTQGTVKIGGLAMNKIDYWEVKNIPLPYISGGLNPNTYASGMYMGSCPNHKSIYNNLADVLIYGKESFINAEDALESLRIIDGIIKSSNKKREVLLSEIK